MHVYPLAQQKGSVLVIVLVIMTIGVGLSLYISRAASDVVTSAFLLDDKLKAKLEAESQLEKLRFLLATNASVTSWVHITDRDFDPALPERMPLTGRPITMQHSVVRLLDTASLITLPWVQPAVLQRLMLVLGSSPAEAAHAADSLQDWLDADDFKHLNGAEKFDYRQLGITAWTPRNNPSVQAKEELGLVAEMRKLAVWPQLAKYLVWLPRGGVNLNTASVPMLQALLDITQEQAAQLVERRQDSGRLTEADLLQIIGRGGGLDDGTYNTFPNRAVLIKIGTSIGEAKEQLTAVLDFNPTAGAAVTTLRYSP